MASRLFPHTRLRGKIRLIAMAATVFALTVMTLGYGAWQYESQRGSALAAMGVVAGVMSLDVGDALYNLDRKAATEQLRAAAISPGILAACLFDQDGKLFSLYSADEKNMACPAEMETLAAMGRPGRMLARLLPRAAQEMEFHRLQSGLYYISPAVRYRGQVYGRLYMVFALPGLGAMLAANALTLAILFFVSSAVALLLADFLQRDVSGPIVRLALAMRQIAREKDYGMRMRKNTDDEIGDLIEQFNFMLAEIETRDRELLSARIHLEKILLQRTEALEKSLQTRV